MSKVNLDDLTNKDEIVQQELSDALEVASIINRSCNTPKDIKSLLARTAKILKSRFTQLQICVLNNHE